MNVTSLDFRHYDNALGRFFVVDPMAELAYSITPYRYGFNNPIIYKDPTGMFEEDNWYENIKTRAVVWIDGDKEQKGYRNLGYNVSDQGYGPDNADHLRMLGDLKQIWVNGTLIADFNEPVGSNKRGGFAFSDGGNSQNSGSLESGGRDVQWIDTRGMFEIFVILINTKFRSFSSPKGKGTNGGRPTFENKVDDGINAVNSASDALREGYSSEAKQKMFFMTVYSLDTIHLSEGRLSTSSIDIFVPENLIDSINRVNNQFYLDSRLWLEHVKSIQKNEK